MDRLASQLPHHFRDVVLLKKADRGNPCGARIHAGSWTVHPIFEELRLIGDIAMADYRRTFNLGIGMILACGPAKVKAAKDVLDKLGENWFELGSIIESPVRGVLYAE